MLKVFIVLVGWEAVEEEVASSRSTVSKDIVMQLPFIFYTVHTFVVLFLYTFINTIFKRCLVPYWSYGFSHI